VIETCDKAHAELEKLPKDVIRSTFNIQKMIRDVVEFSLDGMKEAEKEWVLNSHLREYLQRQKQ